MTDLEITSMPCGCWHTVQRKLCSWILLLAQQEEQVQKYWHSVLKRLINIKPAHPEPSKARKSSLQTMRPQQQRRMLNSILLTSLSVNSYNPVIDKFFIPLAHRPSAYNILRSKKTFLGKFDSLSPDAIERLAEKHVTLYQDDIEQRFSNEFVDYPNEFLDYAKTQLIYDTFFTR